MKKKIWIFIGRLNPPHLWHISVIEKALQENDYTMLFLWSINICNDKNPFSFEQRKEMLKLYFDDKIIIEGLDDFSSDLTWINNLKNKISKHFDIKNIFLNIYGGELEQDYAIKVIKQFENEFCCDLNFIEIWRKTLSINYKWEKYFISSTKIREALKYDNYDLVKEMMNKKIFNFLFKIVKNH